MTQAADISAGSNHRYSSGSRDAARVRTVYRLGTAEVATPGEIHKGRPVSLGQSGANQSVFSQICEILARMWKLPEDWNHDGSPKPRDVSIFFAQRFLEEACNEQLEPVRVAPSVVGGVGATFAIEDREAYVEFRNDGRAIMALTGATGEAAVEQFIGESVKEAVYRVQAHLHA